WSGPVPGQHPRLVLRQRTVLVEIAPLFTINEKVEDAPDMRVYTPLEAAGRNIYVREGCYACHSQMIRTLRDEVERYGPYYLAVE
ncbi:cbb3-type cytochrome c oxidase subunit II, partial [Rhizobium johnstonii]|uniref:cbb3-type cytochrome c oxidase subunit II n=1 Tax=Rhizobium johnstonii TaxID=3019933 RepID=UPI003F989E28